MDIREIGVVGLSSERIRYLSEQQKVIARNVANADTPGFKALEMRPFSEVLRSSKVSQPVRTHPGHLSGSTASVSPSARLDRTSPMSPNGNNVVLDKQIANAAEAQIGHSLATSIYKKATGLVLMSVK